MLLSIPKSILRGLMFGASAVVSGLIVGVLAKSVSDAVKGLGPVAFTVLVAFMGTLVYIFYGDGGWVRGIYALVAVLLMHLLMWGVGFYKASR